jgi:hypothetical protein
MTPAPPRPGPPPISTARPEQWTVALAGRDRTPAAQATGGEAGIKLDHRFVATGAAVASAASPLFPLKRPASHELARTSSAKKRANDRSPYHKFCQEARPLLPGNLRNSEREKLLGIAWKNIPGTDKHKFKGSPGGGGKGVQVAFAHAAAVQMYPAAQQPVTAPQLQPQLQLITARVMSKQFTAAVTPPPLASAAVPVLSATRVVPVGKPVGVPVPLLPCKPYPAELGLSVEDLVALTTPTPVPELLTAAAAHRTKVSKELGLARQQQLAKLVEEQMTAEDAVDIAISLGMPH